MTDESASFDAGTSQIEALGLIRLAEAQILSGNWHELEEKEDDQ
ncbi:hypothetical protein PJN93_31640 [Mycobacterium kansasii]